MHPRLLLVVLLATGCASAGLPSDMVQVLTDLRTYYARPGFPTVTLVDDIPAAATYYPQLNLIRVHVNSAVHPVPLRMVLAHEIAHWGLRHTFATCFGRQPLCEHEANVEAVAIMTRLWPAIPSVRLYCVWLKIADASKQTTAGHDVEDELRRFQAHFRLGEDCA